MKLSEKFAKIYIIRTSTFMRHVSELCWELNINLLLMCGVSGRMYIDQRPKTRFYNAVISPALTEIEFYGNVVDCRPHQSARGNSTKSNELIWVKLKINYLEGKIPLNFT